jgi:hypothetical protein
MAAGCIRPRLTNTVRPQAWTKKPAVKAFCRLGAGGIPANIIFGFKLLMVAERGGFSF